MGAAYTYNCKKTNNKRETDRTTWGMLVLFVLLSLSFKWIGFIMQHTFLQCSVFSVQCSVSKCVVYSIKQLHMGTCIAVYSTGIYVHSILYTFVTEVILKVIDECTQIRHMVHTLKVSHFPSIFMPRCRFRFWGIEHLRQFLSS